MNILKYLKLAGVGLIAVIATFIGGYLKGKKAQRTDIIEKGIEDAKETQKRRAKRRLDSDDAVNKRLREFTRR